MDPRLLSVSTSSASLGRTLLGTSIAIKRTVHDDWANGASLFCGIGIVVLCIIHLQ